LPFAAVVDRNAAARAGADFSERPVGTGPFQLREWVRGQRLVFERNPFYFRSGLPYLDRIEAHLGVTDQLAWLMYRSGDLDVARRIPPAEFPGVVTDPRYAPLTLHRTTIRTMYVGLNCEGGPLADPRVRRALNYAVNKERVVDLLNRRGVAARGVLPPEMPGFPVRDTPYRFDPERARRLLRAAGHGQGFGSVLWTRPDDEQLRIAQSVQQDLDRVGVRVRIRPVDWTALLEAVRHRGMVPMFLLGWEADFPDPSNFLDVLLHSRNRGANNHTFFADAEVDRLLDAAAALPPGDARTARYREIEGRVVEAAPWIFLYHPLEYVARNPAVQGYRLHPLRPERLETVWVAAQGDGAGQGPFSSALRP
jgi:ABC-type transport system substrate-binding protein